MIINVKKKVKFHKQKEITFSEETEKMSETKEMIEQISL